MSFSRSIFANSASQLYAVAIGILFIPLYVHYMGIEAYGLVGVYAMLQGWFVLLDLGLTPTVARETARFRGGASQALDLRRLFRALEGVFVLAALVGALILIALSGFIAGRWLNLETQGIGEVQRALCLMAAVISLRWLCGLYRGAITGFEDLVWLGGFTVVIATIRFALVVPFLIVIGATVTHFFAFQLGVALIELALLIVRAYKLLPAVDVRGIIPWQWRPVRTVLPFALSAAFTGAVWVIVTNTDKLILSGLVSLTDYGYFTLAVLVASGITLLSNSIGTAILPRLTSLHAQGDEAALVRLYRVSTQLILVVSTPIVLVLALFPEQLLLAWTDQPLLSDRAAPVLALYAIGNGLLILITFTYYLQIARGDLSLHVIYNLFFLAIFIPLLFVTVSRFGVVGAGYAWIVANLFPVLAWLPVVHRRHMRGVHATWILRDVAGTLLLPVAGAVAARYLIPWSPRRIWLLVELMLLYGALVALAACTSSAIRARVGGIIGGWAPRFLTTRPQAAASRVERIED